jgi:methionyl-tRNA formyltransferase
MLPEVVWAMPRLGTFNLHASLLPQYRGAAPINWAVMNGDKETGVTTFLLKHEIDTGNLIMQERIAIGEDENVGSVHDRLMALGATVVLKTVDRIIECESQGIALPTTPQPELAELRPAPKIFKEDCEIQFAEKTAEEVHNFVRGLSPYPAAWANLTIHGQAFENVKIYKVEISKCRDLEISKNDIIVPCKEGAVRILELQAPGKKRMDARSFLNGIHA